MHSDDNNLVMLKIQEDVAEDVVNQRDEDPAMEAADGEARILNDATDQSLNDGPEPSR